ncbi:contact-dependent growth inhibition system immunity protein [Roseivirga sp.]|uniref:contact-dependent growth inhibition system immunity protein n=1 Tax=Roseivirga sp. TaxID=1964215 RepID=UPI003BAC2D94
MKFLIPLALEELSINILAEGDYYCGDLLKVVLMSEETFWINSPKLAAELSELITSNWQTLTEEAPELLKEYLLWKKRL